MIRDRACFKLVGIVCCVVMLGACFNRVSFNTCHFQRGMVGQVSSMAIFVRDMWGDMVGMRACHAISGFTSYD